MLVCGVGHLIPADAPEGLCPMCLIELAEPRAIPKQIGPFRVLKLLGEGGFGLVYEARREGAIESVALKVLRGLDFADAAVVAQFRREPTLSAKLKPEYVVKVLEVVEDANLPYFTMEYLAGKTLRERMAQYHDAPQRAAELMIQIATAVQYLHRDPERPEREPILHRDLKPENILFGADDRPRISDFGIAKLAKGNTWTVGAKPVGCPAYMAPEQVYPNSRRELTAAADVYALGAILYELFTGRAPFEGTEAEILSQLRDDEPVPPRRLAPQLDRFLETVVLNALEKDPARRYRSAASFAQDLERALQKKPPEDAPPVAATTRLRTWIRRNPLRSAACVWAASLLCVVGVSARTTLAGRTQSLERDQELNASVAGMQAVAVNLQLQAYKHRIAELAQEPEVIALLTSSAQGAYPAKGLQDRAAPFDTMFVMGPDGRQRARTSLKPPEYLARSFEFRDYFKGARRLAREVCRDDPSADSAVDPRQAYLARAYTSESDGHFEFAISAPLCQGQTWLGIIAGSIAIDKVLGAVRLLDDRHGRIATVLGPRDRERAQANLPLPSDLTFIVHPGLLRGQALPLRQPEPIRIRAALGIPSDTEAANRNKLRYAAPLRVDDYRDPVAGFEGAWSAVFAAADESGYVVAVQSRRDVTPLGQVLVEKLALPAGIPFAVGLLTLGFLGLARRRQAPTIAPA